ncbi:TonB-dependent receptor family protein [uncultured Psychroserpens sp.]|uniref:TonB-dependent receptor family protein n=1 Tax=uncultured Psychroserpens sp. TaxID=255436 RepID=UPI00260D820B|nr:TonB-dependent receptor family protein [uncultured Psychroserpens sp.]
MFKILKIIPLFLITVSSYAQQSNTFKGTVLDSSTQELIPFATVIAYNNTKLINGVSTDNYGEFILNTRQPISHLEITFIGYKNEIIKIEDIVDSNFITVKLKTSLEELDAVVINTEQTTSKLKLDRKIINIGRDLQQAGATALEAFDQITEIQTDLGTGSLTLRGSQNVRLLVNGKPSSLSPTELLAQIPSSTILRVELITSPSAKNQADGLSGIINVILKKNTLKGLNSNLNAGFGTKRYNYGLDGNYNFSFLNFRWNLSQSGREMDSKQQISQIYNNGNTRDFFAPHDFSGLVRKIDTGLDLFIDDQNELSIGFDYTDDAHSFYNDTFYTNVIGRDDFIYTRNSSHHHKTTNINANYRTQFKKENHFLEIDYQFSKNNNLLPAIDFEEGVLLFEEKRTNNNKLNALALDYSFPVTENILIETGASWNKRLLESSNVVRTVNEPETLAVFNYEEILLGIYGLTNIKTGKLTWQLGLRYENLTSNSINNSNSETTDLKFSNFFPSLHASYTINDANTFNLGFSRRVSRPNFRNINPFQSRNQYFEWVANPALKPEFSYNFETNYQYHGNKLTASLALFYRHRKDVIERLQSIDSNGVLMITFDNIGKKHSYGIETSTTYKLTDFWNSQLSANYYHTNVNQDVPLTWNELYSSNLIFKNTFKINRSLGIDISYRHNFKTQNAFNFIEPRSRIDLAARLNLLENRLSISLRIVDLLDNNLMHRTTATQNVIQHEVWRFQSQTFGYLFSMNYKLFQNKQKLRNRKNRNYNYGGTTD